MLHPNIFETTLADVALHATLWVPMHAAALAAVVLTLVGLIGLYASRAHRLGRLGAVGFGLVVPGLVATACVAYAEAFLLPVIARVHPEVLDWDGPVTTDWPVRITTLLALLWFAGLFLLGLALWRARAVPVPAAATLTVAVAAAAVCGGLLVPVLSPLAVLGLAVGYGWVGVALWTGADGSSRAGAPDRPRRRAAAGRG